MSDDALIKAMLWLAIAWMLLTAFAADALIIPLCSGTAAWWYVGVLVMMGWCA